MDAEQLLTRVAALIWPDVGDLTCEEPGHGGGHTCLPVPAGTHLAALVDTLGSRYGDPVTVTEASDLPSLPSAERTSWVCAWPFGGRWIAYGRPPHGETTRPVVTVAPRTTPGPDRLPAEASWLDRLTAVTGWASARLPAVNWTAIESRLNTGLPTDYKRLVETFGHGQFDGFLDVFSPEEIIRYSASAAHRPQNPWEPHPPFPAPGGLLPWAGNEHEQSFCWIADGPDPDQWPVYATYAEPEEGHRFDCTATEFLFHQLTDRHHPFRLPVEFQAHWFQSHNAPGGPL